MIVALYALLDCLFRSAMAADRIFLPDSNYGNVANWGDRQLPCDKSHVFLPTKAPRIFLDGPEKVYRISEMSLPMDGEMVLDDRVVLTSSRPAEEGDCQLIEAHYRKTSPDFWYDPGNWCQTHGWSSCIVGPRVEASLVPSSEDRAIFRRGRTFYVGFKASEGPVVVREVYLRGPIYRNTFVFRERIARNRTKNIFEFVNVDRRSPPVIQLKGNKCNRYKCLLNSNLKKMNQICSYVTCMTPACRSTVKPVGSCCPLCGKVFNVTVATASWMGIFENWFQDLVDSHYKGSLAFNILFSRMYQVQVVLSTVDLVSDLPDSLASEIVQRILRAKDRNGVISIKETSWILDTSSRSAHSSALVVILIVLAVLVISAALVALRSKIPFLPVLSAAARHHLPDCPTITLPTVHFHFFREAFPRSRLNEEVEPMPSVGGTYPAMSGAIEVIEMPEKTADVSFDNPIYDSEIAFEDSVQ